MTFEANRAFVEQTLADNSLAIHEHQVVDITDMVEGETDQDIATSVVVMGGINRTRKNVDMVSPDF